MWSIREMTMEDYAGVYRLWMETPGMGLNTTDDSPEGIAGYLRRNPTTCFVAERKGRVIGVILSGHDGRRGSIHHMAVRMEARGQGIGGALLEHAVRALQAEGIAKVTLVVFKRNEVGNAFWEKKGFFVRDDLVYRDKSLVQLQRVDT